MLKIIDDDGDIVYEFNQSGSFGMIENRFLIDMATGAYDKSEIKAMCHLMNICRWDNMVEKEIGKGAKVIGITYKAYAELFNRLIEKKVILVNEDDFYFNPSLFRRKAFKKKTPFVPWNNKVLHNDKTKEEFDT